MIHVGYPGSCHDSTVYQQTKIAVSPHLYFTAGEYLLSDSAYTARNTIVPAYKGPQANTPQLSFFNMKLAVSRVRIEHAIGILKGRWGSLREMRMQLRNKSEFEFFNKWVVVCVMLHNLLAKIGDQWFDLFEENDLIPQHLQGQVIENSNTQSLVTNKLLEKFHFHS